MAKSIKVFVNTHFVPSWVGFAVIVLVKYPPLVLPYPFSVRGKKSLPKDLHNDFLSREYVEIELPQTTIEIICN